MKTPDEQVAERILAEFKQLGVLTEHTLKKLEPKLPAGLLSAADWKLLFEIDRPKKEGEDVGKN